MTATSTARVRDYASLIRFSHTVFALPFALIALFVATDGAPGLVLLLQIVTAMVFARSAAMAFNRWLDRDIDARNPRTAAREIPRGVISARAAMAFTIACSVGFLGVAASLGEHCFWLAWPTLGVLLGYSYAKRFTAAAHLWLGIALGLAPPAAWVAAVGGVDASVVPAMVLGGAVAVWVAGFDVLYACQDLEFDRSSGLRSIPVALGVRGALRAARILHVAALVGFGTFGVLAGLGLPYAVGGFVAAAFLVVEHRILRADDLSRIPMAFFTMNGLVALVLLAATLIDVYC
ncbi:MAG: putative 4-hydroxybenzoate polyprenyltransferase [Planctomycetes bacterium]|nr:putative 4-hydroxybenzoate polyprenyltransferase [Planctomycetota bacterium]